MSRAVAQSQPWIELIVYMTFLGPGLFDMVRRPVYVDSPIAGSRRIGQ